MIDSYLVLFMVTIAGDIALPFSILIGFFESRESGLYRFRRWRLLVAVIALAVLNVLAGFSMIHNITQAIVAGGNTAETAVYKNRATQNYVANNLRVAFPEVLTADREQCYRSAISNYVEDLWNKAFRESVCVPDMKEKFKEINCDGKQEDYYGVIHNKLSFRHKLKDEFAVIGYVTRRMLREPEASKLLPPTEQMLANYQHYFAECTDLKPQRWVDPSVDVLESPIQICVGQKCQ
jgi:hypothetical protein